MAATKPELLITEAPVTAEAREALLREQFSDDFPHDGKLLVPDDNFYAKLPPINQAAEMCKQLCVWLGIEPKQIGLVFEGKANDANDSSHYRIFIETDALRNEFILGASLAHALVRYLLEDRKHIRLKARDQQDALISTASILFGLGIIISNGLLPRYTWLEAAGIHKQVHNELLGHVKPGQYHQQLRACLKRYRVPEVRYVASCAPWTRHRLGCKPAERPIHAVHVAKHQIQITRLKVLGTAWLVMVVGGLALVIAFHRVLPPDPRLQTAQDNANLMKRLADECHSTLAYQKQYTDTNDVLSQQSVDAQATRCTSFDNQYHSAQAYYDDLNK